MVTKAGDEAGLEVKNARAAFHKMLRKLELEKLVRPDDLRKAEEGMEKVVRKGNDEVKNVVEVGRRNLEEGGGGGGGSVRYN